MSKYKIFNTDTELSDIEIMNRMSDMFDNIDDDDDISSIISSAIQVEIDRGVVNRIIAMDLSRKINTSKKVAYKSDTQLVGFEKYLSYTLGDTYIYVAKTNSKAHTLLAVSGATKLDLEALLKL